MSLRSRTIEISRKEKKIVMVGLGFSWNRKINYIEGRDRRGSEYIETQLVDFHTTSQMPISSITRIDFLYGHLQTT